MILTSNKLRMKAQTDEELWGEVQYWAGMLHEVEHNYRIADEIVQAINHYKSQLKEREAEISRLKYQLNYITERTSKTK